MAPLVLALVAAAALAAPAAAARQLHGVQTVAAALAAGKAAPVHAYATEWATYQPGFAVSWVKLGEIYSCNVTFGKLLCNGDPTCARPGAGWGASGLREHFPPQTRLTAALSRLPWPLQLHLFLHVRQNLLSDAQEERQGCVQHELCDGAGGGGAAWAAWAAGRVARLGLAA